MNREGLGQRRIKKITQTLNIIGRLGFLKPTQKNMDNYFNWLRNSDYTYSTKLTNWFIYTRYTKWLNPRLKFDYKLSATVKQILPEILTIEEVQRMINSTENSRDRAVLSLLFDSGCRPGELVSLKIEDIIFDEEGLIVNTPVEGKRGQRRIRIVNTVNSEQSLKEWLKYHRFKNDPYSPLFYRLDRRTKDTYDFNFSEYIRRLIREDLNKEQPIIKGIGKRI